MEEFELEPGEEVIRVVRQHVFVIATRLLAYLLLALMPAVLAVFIAVLQHAGPQLGTGVSLLPQGLHGIGRVLTGLWLLFIWMGAFTTFLKYYLTCWVITSTRIVDIRQYGFFSREVSSFLLIRVQDITTEIHGMLPTLIGFGHLHVETAGNDESFSMSGVAHPQQLRDLILKEVALLHTPGSTNSGV
jgi:hypothetical protein